MLWGCSCNGFVGFARLAGGSRLIPVMVSLISGSPLEAPGLFLQGFPCFREARWRLWTYSGNGFAAFGKLPGSSGLIPVMVSLLSGILLEALGLLLQWFRWFREPRWRL